MSSRYLPVAQVRLRPETPRVLVKSTAHQSALRSFCPLNADGAPAPYYGLSCIHIEAASPSDVPQVRVEVEGRTIGFLSREDTIRYRFKMQNEGLGDHPLGVPVSIRGGSLKDEGPPYFFFAELLVDLKPDEGWEYDPIADPEPSTESPLSVDTNSEEGSSVNLPVPSGAMNQESTSAHRANRVNIGSEILGRGLGFMICIVLFYLFYCVYFLLFFK